jgi:ubiquinol-cytochrome c reductase cytochrome c subunit
MTARGRWIAPLAAIGFLAVVVAAAAQPNTGIVHPSRKPGQSEIQFGAELYAANCVSCHGIGGQGVNPPTQGKGSGMLNGAGPSLRGVGAQAPDFYLSTGRMPIGHPGEEPMRQRPFFDEAEIRAMTAYVASLAPGPPIPHPHPAGTRLSLGFKLFTEHCAGCHQVVGEGGYVTDTRVPVLQHASSTQIAEAVRIGPYLMPRFSRKAISDRKLDAIIAYVNASKHPTDAGGLGIGHIGPVPEGIVAWLIAAVVLVGVCVVIGERRRA